MRQQISKPLITVIKLDNGDMYDFSLSPRHPNVPFPFDVICIRKSNEFSDIVFIFNIITLIGGTINGNIAEYKSERYYV